MGTLMNDLTNLIRPEINNLPTYNAGLALDRFRDIYGVICLAKLDSNENPHGPSSHAIDAIQQGADKVSFYPDATSLNLRQQIGAGVNIPADRLVMGNGSEDLIGAIFRATLRRGDHVITICPSFGLHEFGAMACGATVAKIPFNADWSFPVKEVVEQLTKVPRVLIFSSPSNPAGPTIREDEFDVIINALSPETLFVFDEAYVEFVSEDARFDALAKLNATKLAWVSLRTFSKAYGLAGIRVGYGICAHATIAGALMKARNPFGVNALAAAAAGSAYADQKHLKESVHLIVSERHRLQFEMAARGYKTAPSQANFLFFECGENGVQFAEKLRHKGILIKGWLEEPYLNWARVSVGLPEQNDAFLNALDHDNK